VRAAFSPVTTISPGAIAGGRLGFFGVNAGGREERSERAAGEQGVKSGQMRSLPIAGRLVA
jgi:hypothetical protein